MTINRLRFFLPFINAPSVVPYVKIFRVSLLHFNLSNAPIKKLNCFILLERYYIETISFVTSCSIIHENRLNLLVAFPLTGYCSQIIVYGWRHLPYFVFYTPIIRTKFLSHYEFLSLLFPPIIYPILPWLVSGYRPRVMAPSTIMRDQLWGFFFLTNSLQHL